MQSPLSRSATSGLLPCVIIGVICVLALSMHAGLLSQEQPHATTHNPSTVCSSSHGTAHDMEGQLTAHFDDDGNTVTGWTCVISSHHICTAGPDGRWTECTFAPDVMPWPDPVPASVVRDPPHPPSQTNS